MVTSAIHFHAMSLPSLLCRKQCKVDVGKFSLQILRHDSVPAHPHQVQQCRSAYGVVLFVEVGDFEVLENIVHNQFVPLVVDAAATVQYGCERVLFLAACHGVFFQGCWADVDHERKLFLHVNAALYVHQVASLQENVDIGSLVAAASPKHDVGSVALNQPLHFLEGIITDERTVASIQQNGTLIVAENV